MHALEDQMGDYALHDAFFRLHQINILRSYNCVHRLVASKAFIHAREIDAQDLNQPVFYHGGRKNVALADKVGNESILRLIVNVLRRSDLLDVALIHDYDGIGHGEGFLLVMGNIYEGDAKLVLETDQFILHILTQL